MGRFLFVKTFSPHILRQMAQVFGSPEQKIHPDCMSFPETHGFQTSMTWACNQNVQDFWKGFPWAYVDIFVGVSGPERREHEKMMKTCKNPPILIIFYHPGRRGGVE